MEGAQPSSITKKQLSESEKGFAITSCQSAIEVPPNLLQVRVPEPEELHQIRNVRQAASELAQEVWEGAEAPPKSAQLSSAAASGTGSFGKGFLEPQIKVCSF